MNSDFDGINRRTKDVVERIAPRRRREGFTLVELLTVIVIIGMLAALATPVLLNSMARGRLTGCMNNQYQLASALGQYNEQRGLIPGWLNTRSPNDLGASAKVCNWTVPLLPYLGRADLYDAWPDVQAAAWPTILRYTGTMSGAAYDAHVAALTANRGIDLLSTVSVLRCASNPPIRGQSRMQSRRLGPPPLHYAANAGASGTSWHDGVFLNLTGTSAPRPLSLDDIAEADGTATTLAFAERASKSDTWHTWATSTSTGTSFGYAETAPAIFGVGSVTLPPRAKPAIPPVINNPDAVTYAPSSRHADGVTVAYCDGHTGFLNNTIDTYVYAQLLTPKTRWKGTTFSTIHAPAMRAWLLGPTGTPYMLDESVLK